MKITLAQLNPVVGDVRGNLQKIAATLAAESQTSDLVVFSELFLVGYPPRDLLEKPGLIRQVQEALEHLMNLSARYPATGILVGAPQPTGRDTGKGLCNCAVLIYQGQVRLRQAKSLLPTYDVFDETRHFDPAWEVTVLPFKDEILGISICEDAWYDPELWCRRLYPLDPIQVQVRKGATVLINMSASPFQVGKEEVRHRLFQCHARKYGIPLVYVNQVGGNDELIFDGRSQALDRAGEAIAVLPGLSRSGATISTGLVLGNKREEVTRFSFLMVLVPVIGLDVVGKPLVAGQVHRPELVAALSLAALGDPVTPEMIAAVLAHPQGGAKGFPPLSRQVSDPLQGDPPLGFVPEVQRNPQVLLRQKTLHLISPLDYGHALSVKNLPVPEIFECGGTVNTVEIQVVEVAPSRVDVQDDKRRGPDAA